MKVIVVGGGKVGYFLAQTLTEHGHEPHIVEKDKTPLRQNCQRAGLPLWSAGTAP